MSDDTISEIGSGLSGIIAAIIGLATLAIILSQKSATTSVITSLFTGLTGLVTAATTPVTGGTNATGGGAIPTISLGGSSGLGSSGWGSSTMGGLNGVNVGQAVNLATSGANLLSSGLNAIGGSSAGSWSSFPGYYTSPNQFLSSHGY